MIARGAPFSALTCSLLLYPLGQTQQGGKLGRSREIPQLGRYHMLGWESVHRMETGKPWERRSQIKERNEPRRLGGMFQTYACFLPSSALSGSGHCSNSHCLWRRLSSLAAKGVAVTEELRVLASVASFPTNFLLFLIFFPHQSLSL